MSEAEARAAALGHRRTQSAVSGGSHPLHSSRGSLVDEEEQAELIRRVGALQSEKADLRETVPGARKG